MNAQRRGVDVAARCIIARGDKLLFQRGKQKNFYRLPGGRLEAYENLPLCLAREMMEEAGIQVSVGRLYIVNENFYYFRGRLKHELVLYFACTMPSGSEPRSREEHVVLEWHRPAEILEYFKPRRILEEIMRDMESGTGFRRCRYIQTWEA
jgi:8-oxo-dGTP diphosphatase